MRNFLFCCEEVSVHADRLLATDDVQMKFMQQTVLFITKQCSSAPLHVATRYFTPLSYHSGRDIWSGTRLLYILQYRVV